MSANELKTAAIRRLAFLERASQLAFSSNLALSAHLQRAKDTAATPELRQRSADGNVSRCPSCGIQWLKGWSCEAVKLSEKDKARPRRIATPQTSRPVQCTLCRQQGQLPRTRPSRKQRASAAERAALREEAMRANILPQRKPADGQTLPSHATSSTISATPSTAARKKQRAKNASLQALLNKKSTSATSGFNLSFTDLLKK